MTLGEGFSEVMEGARRGEQASIAILYREVNPQLLRYLRAREPQEADDLCSDVWIKLAEMLPTFRGSERQWWGLVFLIARRQLSDHRKRQMRRATDPVAAEMLAALPSSLDVEGTWLRSVTTADAAALVSALLTPEQADVIMMRVVAGLDVDEVAAAIGKRPGTVRIIQHRALRRLAARMSASTRASRAGRNDLGAVAHPAMTTAVRPAHEDPNPEGVLG